jgi:hypothetical protein
MRRWRAALVVLWCVASVARLGAQASRLDTLDAYIARPRDGLFAVDPFYALDRLTCLQFRTL